MTTDLWLVFTSLLLFSVGYGLYFFSWPLFVQSLGAGAVELGYLTALASFIAAVAVIPGGYLADRFERRWQLILGWAICIPVPLFFLAARDWRQLWPGVALFAASVFNTPTISAYVASKAEPGRLASAMSVVWAGFSVGFIAGPLLATPIEAAWGIAGVFRTAAALYLLSTVVLFWLTRDEPLKRADQPSRAWIRPELPDHRLFRTCILFAGIATMLYLTNSYVAPYARDVLHRGVGWVNAAGSVAGLGGALLAVWLGRYADQVGPRRSLAVGLGLYALSMAGLVLVGRWPVVWVALGLRGTLDAIKALMMSTVAHEVPPERLGRSLGFYNLMTGVGYTIGPVVGGYAYAANPAIPFWLAGGIAAALGLAMWRRTVLPSVTQNVIR